MLKCFNFIMSTLPPPPPPPVGLGSTYCFTAVGVGGIPITTVPPAQFFWVECFLLLSTLSFDFCYDLDIWAQGQPWRAFFVVISFFTILSKV